MSEAPTYPFAPKSNKHLHAGQFWAIPLGDGRFAAGRIMAVPAFGEKDTRGFVAGLMDWIGSAAPDADAFAGRAVVDQFDVSRRARDWRWRRNGLGTA